MVFSVIFFVTLYLSQCHCIIYSLNESDYSLMPPLFSLDEYTGCLQVERGLYCMVELQLHDGRNHSLMDMIRQYSLYDVKHYNHTVLNRGICVRKSCGKYIGTLDDSVDLKRSLEACVNASIWEQYGLEAKLSSMLYCDRYNEPMEINTLDWIVLGALFVVLTLNIVGSCYEYFINNNCTSGKLEGNKYILCFSVMRNWRYLTDTDVSHDVTNEKTRHLTLLHGVRCIVCVIVIIPHSYLLIAGGFTENTLDYEKTYNYPLYHLMYNGMNIVQIFFFISGLLLAHKLCYIEQERRLTVLDIPKILFFRIIRWLPVLMLVLALSMSWVRLLGSGPLWKLFVSGSLVADCRRYCWHTLLFIGNYVPDNKYCIIPAWHLSAELQVFTVGLVSYVLTRGQARVWTLRAVLILGTLAPAAHVLLQDLDAIIVLKPEFYRTLINPTFRFLHILGHNNLPCFVIGLFSGTSLHDWYKRGRKISNNWLASCIPYSFLGALVLIFYSGQMFYAEGPRAPTLVRMVYAAAVRPVIGVLCSFGILGSIQGNSTLRRVLEHRSWAIPSRLSFCVFLIHMPLIHIALGTRHTLSHVAFYRVALFNLVVTIISFVTSVPVHLLVEAPFNRLLGILRDQDINSSFVDKKPVDKIQ